MIESQNTAIEERAKSRRWRQHLEDLLMSAESSIKEAEHRIADQPLLIEGLTDARQVEVSLELHRNTQEGLRLLQSQREMLKREIAYLIRRMERDWRPRLEASGIPTRD